MYCPGCGSSNENEVRFCRRCGVNLGVVSDALSGRPADLSQIDERIVTLFKDYYRGRNAMIVGGVASLIALFKAVLFALIGLPVRADFLATLAALLLLYGLISLVWGVAKWNNAASEIKAIERAASAGKPVHAAEDHAGLLSAEAATISSAVPSTDPLGFPGSATEQTTRQLDRQKLLRESNKRAEESD